MRGKGKGKPPFTIQLPYEAYGTLRRKAGTWRAVQLVYWRSLDREDEAINTIEDCEGFDWNELAAADASILGRVGSKIGYLAVDRNKKASFERSDHGGWASFISGRTTTNREDLQRLEGLNQDLDKPN